MGALPYCWFLDPQNPPKTTKHFTHLANMASWKVPWLPVQLGQDHPGFHDPVYRERCAILALEKSWRNLFFWDCCRMGGRKKCVQFPQRILYKSGSVRRSHEWICCWWTEDEVMEYNIDEIYTAPLFMPSFPSMVNLVQHGELLGVSEFSKFCLDGFGCLHYTHGNLIWKAGFPWPSLIPWHPQGMLDHQIFRGWGWESNQPDHQREAPPSQDTSHSPMLKQKIRSLYTPSLDTV